MARRNRDSQEETSGVSCTFVLHLMVLLGFMVNYMLRANMTIAIVDMTLPMNKTDVNGTLLEQNITLEERASPRYDWDAVDQNNILGWFYWGYILTELPGGRLAEVIGPKRVFFYAKLIASIVTLFTPLAASLGAMPVVATRVIVGFMLGATFPATQPIASKWIPPTDRTKFVSHMMASSFGAAVTLPLCGQLIAYFGWESVFYSTGVVGVIWCVAWYLLIFDSPAQHPRITQEEKQRLETAIGPSATARKAHKVPWKQLLSSAPVWAIVVCHGVNVFCFFTIANQLPTYLNAIHHFDIKKNGFYSSLPYLGKYIMALSTGVIADAIRRSGRLSVTATRKSFTLFAIGIPAFLMLAQVFLGENAALSITIFTLVLTVNGAVTAGHLGNGLDIAPNYSGTIFGMANTLSSLGGFLSSNMVGWLTKDNQTYGQWQIVFWILAGAYLLSCSTFLIFGTGELQSWNTPQSERTERVNGHVKEEEAQPLKVINSNGNEQAAA